MLQYLIAPVPELDAKCRNADAGGIKDDATGISIPASVSQSVS
jgi:hypothetical protein